MKRARSDDSIVPSDGAIVVDIGGVRYWDGLNEFHLNPKGPGCETVPVSFDGETGEETFVGLPPWPLQEWFPDTRLFTAATRLEAVRGVECAVCDREWCDLVSWIPRNSNRPNFAVLRVHRDRDFWDAELRPELDRFAADLAALRRLA